MSRPSAIVNLHLILIIAFFAGQGVFARGSASEPLRVYTYDAFPAPLISLVEEHFARQRNRVVVFERYADAGGILNELLYDDGGPRADIVIGLDSTHLPLILENDLLEAYRPDAAEFIDQSLLIDDSFHVVPFDYGGVTLNYDSSVIEDPPEDWEDLLDPRFEKSIILMNPATSSTGRIFLLWSVLEFGTEDFLDFWAALKPNILTVTSTWYEGYGLYFEGEAPIVLSYETSPAYHREYESTDRYQTIYLDRNAYVQLEVAGIVAGTQLRSDAEALIEFILSREFQSEIPLNQFMYPVRRDIELPASFEAPDSSRRLVRLRAEQVDAGIDDWIEAWESVMR